MKQYGYDMHRVEEGQQNDWDGVDPNERNIWQRVAAKTRGILTPGNVVTLAGFASVMTGVALRRSKSPKRRLAGTALIMAGRAGDKLDGTVAEVTGTKSKANGRFEAAADFWEVVAVLGSLTVGEQALVPATETAANTALTGVKYRAASISKNSGGQDETSFIGKVQTGLFWLGTTQRALAKDAIDFGRSNLSERLEAAGRNTSHIALAANVASTIGYTRAANRAAAAFIPNQPS